MVIYEITATVRADLADSYETYTREIHIPDLLATGFFVGAKLTRAGENRYRIQYLAPDRKALDEYLEKEAPRLRADFLAHFPAGVELAREIWEVLREWAEEKSA
jgi:hypothetical protein